MNYRYFISYQYSVRKSGTSSFFARTPTQGFASLVITLGQPIDSQKTLLAVVDQIKEMDSKELKCKKNNMDIVPQSIQLLKIIESADPEHKAL
ncbi:MAG TPA: hypothetical protein VJK04_00680 [Candidatus Paceibacterota bacterium]